MKDAVVVPSAMACVQGLHATTAFMCVDGIPFCRHTLAWSDGIIRGDTLYCPCWCRSFCSCCRRYVLPEDQVASAVEAALELVNMKEFMHRATHTLSGGQRQRVAIAGMEV